MTLKTITDEGKREFEELARRVENTDDPEIIAFMHGFAEKVATETMKAILPEWKMHDGAHNGFRASIEQALQTFLGKDAPSIASLPAGSIAQAIKDSLGREIDPTP